LKGYDGSLILLATERLLILKNVKGDPIVVQVVHADSVSKEAELYPVGIKIKFQLHSIRLGKCWPLLQFRLL
jgi:hypothetical protein